MENRVPVLESFFEEYGVSTIDRSRIRKDLSILAKKDKATYYHSLRVTLVAMQMAQFFGLDPRPLLYAAPRHDIGKKDLPDSLFRKTRFTQKDMKIMEKHPLNTYNHLEPTNLFSAMIDVRHHKYNFNPYPKRIPKSQVKLSKKTEKLVEKYAKIISLADWWESALYRKNRKFAGKKLSLEFLKEAMLIERPKLKSMVNCLFENKFFTGTMITTAKRNKKLFPAQLRVPVAARRKVFRGMRR